MSDDTAPPEATQLIVDAVRRGADAVGRAFHGPMSGNEGDVDLDDEPNAVIEHLMIHRSLADHDPDRLGEYLEMARNEVASFRNPFDRAIALTFHLVLDEQMDPWSIDLANFSSLYVDRIRDTPEVDLITGGRLLAMAWNILLAQTDELLARADPEQEDEEEIVGWDDMMWDEMPDAWHEPEDPDTQYTQHVLDEDNEPPISESVFHQGDRRVTLFELVEALEEGRRDAERRKRLTEERRKAREREAKQAEEDGEDVSEKVHKEDLEAEIHDVRERFKDRPVGEELSIHDVHDGTREDFLTVFVSSLFLSRAHMIDVRQDEFPYTPILVTPQDLLHDPEQPLVGVPKDTDKDFDAVAEEADKHAEAAHADADPDAHPDAEAEPEAATPEA